jgi:hypothetical protein
MFPPVPGFLFEERLLRVSERKFPSQTCATGKPSQCQNQEDRETIKQLKFRRQPEPAQNGNEEQKRGRGGKACLTLHIECPAQECARKKHANRQPKAR